MKVKTEKAVGIDSCVVECLKSCRAMVTDGLIILVNIYFVSNIVVVDWESACVVSLYKCKENKWDCSSFKGITLMNVVGKVYGKEDLRGYRWHYL